jgi:hypothetical protein
VRDRLRGSDEAAACRDVIIDFEELTDGMSGRLLQMELLDDMYRDMMGDGNYMDGSEGEFVRLALLMGCTAGRIAMQCH